MINDFLTTIGVATAMLVMYAWGKRDGKRSMANPPATCPCGHTIGEHKEMGTCKAQVKRVLYSEVGSKWGYEWVNCACTKYHGPVPAQEYFNPGTFVQ